MADVHTDALGGDDDVLEGEVWNDENTDIELDRDIPTDVLDSSSLSQDNTGSEEAALQWIMFLLLAWQVCIS